MGVANFGIAGLDWQQRVNWDRMREYRIERARAMMKKHGLGAMLCMYDENVRYITGTLTPGWNRLKPGLRYAMLCGDGRPILFEQGDLGFQIERHSPWIPKENVRHSFAWIKGAAGPASTQQVTKFTKAVLQAMKENGVAGQKLGVDFIDINMSAAASLARNTIAPVRSSSWPSRPSLIRRRVSSRNALFSKKGRVIGVSMKVGASVLTRILCGARSIAIALVKPSIACLVAQ